MPHAYGGRARAISDQIQPSNFAVFRNDESRRERYTELVSRKRNRISDSSQMVARLQAEFGQPVQAGTVFSAVSKWHSIDDEFLSVNRCAAMIVLGQAELARSRFTGRSRELLPCCD